MNMTLPDRKQWIHAGIGAVVILLLAAWVIRLNGVTKTELINRTGQTFETGVVTEILQDNIQEDGTRVGQQTVVVHMTSGEKKGEDLVTTSSAGYLFGAACTMGMKVIVLQSLAGDTVITSVYSMDRTAVIIGFAVLYLAALCLVGGLKGVKGALGLVFTFASILFIYLPLVYLGHSPFWVSVMICGLTTAVTMYLIGGATKKTLCATAGTLAGVIIAGITATVFSRMSGISGWNVSDIETLLTLNQTNGIQVGGLLFFRASDQRPGCSDGCGHVHFQCHAGDLRPESGDHPVPAYACWNACGPRYDGHRLQHPDPGLCRHQHLHAPA